MGNAGTGIAEMVTVVVVGMANVVERGMGIAVGMAVIVAVVVDEL